MKRCYHFFTILLFAAAPLRAAEPIQVSVRDFVIDGPSLAARHAHIKLTGTYHTDQGIDTLYADDQAMILASNAGMNEPSVRLLTENASRNARAAIYQCQQNPYAGCKVTIVGVVGYCALTNTFGATRKTPCLDVHEGGFYVPTPEDVAAQERARQAAEQAALNAKAQALKAYQEAQQRAYDSYQKCLRVDAPAYRYNMDTVRQICALSNPAPIPPAN